MSIKLCVVCGGEFEARGTTKSCSNLCAKTRERQRHRVYYAAAPEKERERQRRKHPTIRRFKMCIVCNGPFEAHGKGSAWRKTCSLKCADDRRKIKTSEYARCPIKKAKRRERERTRYANDISFRARRLETEHRRYVHRRNDPSKVAMLRNASRKHERRAQVALEILREYKIFPRKKYKNNEEKRIQLRQRHKARMMCPEYRQKKLEKHRQCSRIWRQKNRKWHQDNKQNLSAALAILRQIDPNLMEGITND